MRTDNSLPVDLSPALRKAGQHHAGHIALSFLIIFVALDLGTSPPEFSPIGITPWNPTIGLIFALILRRGFVYMPLIFAAQVIATLVSRESPFPPVVWIGEALLVTAVYGAALWTLRRPALRFDVAFASLRDVLLLMSMAVLAAAVVASVYTLGLTAAGLIPPEQSAGTIVRYWIADAIGIIAVTPGLLLMSRRLWPSSVTWPLVAQSASIVAALVVVFGVAGPEQPKLYYILFLPIVWIAVRQGLEGTIVALVLVQFAMLAGLYAGREPSDGIITVQVFLLILSCSALVIGVLISERGRAERRLRLQQDAIARAARLGSMGELAAALAHELNQPLTAIGNYARAVGGAIDRGATALPEARDAADKMNRQVERAAEVIRRLRAFIQVGRMEVAPHRVVDIVDETLDLMHPEMSVLKADVNVAIDRSLPRVSVDLIQIEQVLMNLMRNGAEAAKAAGIARPVVTIAARTSRLGYVAITVSDNGPGFPAKFKIGATSPMASNKMDGLGFGLMLCESIIEAHGGALAIAAGASGGASVTITVPVAGETTARA